jgi:hypothetical protein
MSIRRFGLFALVPAVLIGQEPQPAQKPAAPAPQEGAVVVAAGTRIPLTLMNSVGTKNSLPGDKVYLQTMVPVAVNGEVVIPVGTYVVGTVTQSVRPGKVKGRGEIAMRFDQILFAGGQSVDLTGRLGALDEGNPGTLDRQEGRVQSDSGAAKDAMMVGGTAVAGTAMGNWIGGQGKDAGIGAGAGAAAGVAAVLLTRGPDAVLKKGSTVEMVLSTDLRLGNRDFAGPPPRTKLPR